MSKLTDKQERFTQEYLIDLNATQAAIRAGYSEKTAMEQGHQLLQKTSVSERIKELQKKMSDKLGLSAESIAKRFLAIYDRCMQVEPVMEKQDGKLVETGEYKFDAGNANRALENLGKHTGFYEKDNDQKTPVINIDWSE